jgi:hypothetical protein
LRQQAKAQLLPAEFDRQGDVPGQLRDLAPDVLVDASGPFQAYGDARFRLIEACIAQRVDYMDLADGSEFVAGVTAFDAAAHAAGIFVLSGVSSFPVLTAAVVRRLAAGMTQLASIHGGIAPSPYAGVGENVIRAIAGYAGRPISLHRRGRIETGYPFTESIRYTIAVPGRVPLRSTLFSLVDVPDLRALPALWPTADEVWMGAGPVPEPLHWALIAFAWLVRWRLLPSLSGMSRLMFAVVNRLRWGEHRGGMFVAVTGVDENRRPVTRSWHLLAEGEDGPFIPSMAVESVVRRMLDARRPSVGARAAVTDLELTDYEALFEKRTIYTGTRNEPLAHEAGLFERLLGDAWHGVPGAVRRLHTFSSIQVAEGRCRIERGRGLLSNLIATLFRFPRASTDLCVSVRFEYLAGVEKWTREFGSERLTSTLRSGHDRSEHLLCERLGPFEFAQALVLDDTRLRLVLRRWTICGIPLPLWLAPRSDSHESEQDGRFCFHVEVSHPLVGLIVRYEGWLVEKS